MTDIPIDQEAFVGRSLMLRPATLFSGARLLIDGAPVKTTLRTGQFWFGWSMAPRLGLPRFLVRDNRGNEVAVRLKSNGFDPIPKVDIDGQVLQLARPLEWYEYAWMGLPIVLAIWGGLWGALIGCAATRSSARLFRSERSTFSKYGLSGLISAGAVVAFVVTWTILQIAIKGVPR